MDDNSDYPFIEGNRLLERNTYFYVDCSSDQILHTWLRAREENISWCGMPVEPATAVTGSTFRDPVAGDIDTNFLLTWLLDKPTNDYTLFYTFKLLRKFEVTKRIHAEYDPSFRAINKKDFQNPGMYLQFAQLCIQNYDTHRYLQLLNALLKVGDTLISIRDQLTEEQKPELAWILSKEILFVRELSDGSSYAK
jgi:hypothetical protein